MRREDLIQALDRTQRGLPIHRGRCGTMTHDYERNGTTTLFAAIEMTEGRLIGTCMSQHRHQEWIKFLKQIDAETPAELDLHLIVDLCDAQASQGAIVAETASTDSRAFHSHQQFLVESGRAPVP